jgi:hypothetical protein
VERRLVDLAWDSTKSLPLDARAVMALHLLTTALRDACRAIRCLDDGRPDDARGHLMHSLLCAADPDAIPGERHPLWEDILEGRRNIGEMMRPPGHNGLHLAEGIDDGNGGPGPGG